MDKALGATRVAAVVAIGVVVALLGGSFGYVRTSIAAVIFIGLMTFAYKYWRDVGLIPPETETRDVSEQDLRYVCSMCGLELRVEVAARDKAPTHCAEPMQLVGGTQRAPLRPV